MPTGNACEELNKRAARRLVESHRELEDERLVLAIRYRHNERDLYLFEVLETFPGEDDDEPFETEFDPSAELVILGKLHLTLVNAAQLRTAINRGSEIIDDLRGGGEILFEDGSEQANLLKNQLGLG